MISKDAVLYIANLARIYLEDQEIEGLTRDLEGILGYINQLENLDVSKVEPTSHVLPLKNVLREDEIRPSLPQDEVTHISENNKDGFFKVPPIIE